MHIHQIQQVLSSHMDAASPIQGKSISSVAVKINQNDPQTA